MIPGGKYDSAPLLAFSFRSTVEWRSPRHNVLLEGSELSTPLRRCGCSSRTCPNL